MPIYEYVCQKCGRKTEVIQSHSDPPPKKCPDCGGALKKAFSAPAIQFKGSGFYITDYGKGDAKTARGEGGSDKSERSEKAEKAEKGEKSEKSEASGKSETAGKSESAQKSEKAEKGKKESTAPAASGDSSSSKSEKKNRSGKGGD